MAGKLTLFGAAGHSVRVIQCSPPSWMVQLALVEKGVQHEVRGLNFERGEHKAPELLAMNPRGTVPFLTHALPSGEIGVVSETFAVLEYIEASFAGPNLLPTAHAPRARALTRFHESAYLKNTGMALFAYLMRTPEADRDPARLRSLHDAFEGELLQTESALQGRASWQTCSLWRTSPSSSMWRRQCGSAKAWQAIRTSQHTLRPCESGTVCAQPGPTPGRSHPQRSP